MSDNGDTFLSQPTPDRQQSKPTAETVPAAATGDSRPRRRRLPGPSSFPALVGGISPADPYRMEGGGKRPSVEQVAAGVLQHPEIVAELLRRLAWTEPETLGRMAAALTAARERRDTVREACQAGTFGRDFVARQDAQD